VYEVEGGLTAVTDFITAVVSYRVFLYSFETNGCLKGIRPSLYWLLYVRCP